MPYTLDHGQLLRDGVAMLCLVRACHGDGAPPQAELDALQRDIVTALNAVAARRESAKRRKRHNNRLRTA